MKRHKLWCIQGAVCPRWSKSNIFMSPIEEAPLERKIHQDLISLLSHVLVLANSAELWASVFAHTQRWGVGVQQGFVCESQDPQGLRSLSISALHSDLRCFPGAVFTAIVLSVVRDFLTPLLWFLLSITVLQKFQGSAAPDGTAAPRLQHYIHPERQQKEEAWTENHPAGHRPTCSCRPE